MNLTIDIASTLACLETLDEQVKQGMVSGVKEGGEILRDEIAARTPVRTGRLKRAIENGLKVEVTVDGVTATIESDVPYDPFVDARSQHYERGEAAAEQKVRDAAESAISNALNSR